MSGTSEGARPPIPASLASRPVKGGLAQPWVNVQLADGGADFRSTHRAKYERSWKEGRCQSCGNLAVPYAVLVCGPRQVLTHRFDEPPVCPPCALYASRACPMVAGRTVTYPARPRVVEGKRGAHCAEPGCDCGGWLDIDPEHSADMGGQPALPWYAMWVPPLSWAVTVHEAKVEHEGRKHKVMLVNGGILTAPPLKILLVAEPGNGRIWRKLTDAEAREHAAGWLMRLGLEVPS